MIFQPNDVALDVEGYDPDRESAGAVFTAKLRHDQDAAFESAIEAGLPGREVACPSNDNQPPTTNTVVITDPGPGDGKGPKLCEDATSEVTYYEITLVC